MGKGRGINSKPQTATIGGGSSQSKLPSRTVNQLSLQDHDVFSGGRQIREGSSQYSRQLQSFQRQNKLSEYTKSKAEIMTPKKSTNYPRFSQKGSEPQKHASKKLKKREKFPISIQLYFNLIRWGFAIFVCLACIGVYPLYLVISQNCRNYRNIHGDVGCPISVDILFSRMLLDLYGEDRSIEFYFNYQNQFISRFFLFVMILLAIWAQIQQKIILAGYKSTVKISDFSVILVNLPDEADEDYVRELAS